MPEIYARNGRIYMNCRMPSWTGALGSIVIPKINGIFRTKRMLPAFWLFCFNKAKAPNNPVKRIVNGSVVAIITREYIQGGENL